MSESRFDSLLRRIGRAAAPLLDPDAENRRAREAATKRALEKVSTNLSQLTTALGDVQALAHRLDERLDRLDQRQVERLREAVRSLRNSQRQQEVFAERLLKRSHAGQELDFVRERVLRRLRALKATNAPILIGPWTGEVGFELLYWVPFVRWVKEHFRLDPSRMTIVSRGGTESWYGLTGANYIDVLARRSPTALAEQMAAQKKQRTVRLFDRRLIREISADMPERPVLLHPSLMYALLMPYWKQKVSLRWAEQFVRLRRVEPPSLGTLVLPEKFVAVRFYFSDCFPDTEANREVVRSVLTELARRGHVVVLGSRVGVDEHRDALVPELSSRVHVVDHMADPQRNLATQTAVLARASAFVGTYGGFSYLAPLCGVDTVAFYSEANFYEHHLDFAQQAFALVGGGSLTVIDTAVRDLVAQVAHVAVQQ